VPTTPLTNLGNLRGLTDENGTLKVVAVTAGSGTSPLTPFANLRGTTDETGALRVASITLNPPVSKPTDLSNLRVCTDETGALLVASGTAGAIGPLTNLGNVQARTDARGSLLVANSTAGSLASPLTPLLNLRGRTDDQGALVVTGLSNPLAYQQRILADGAAAYWPLNDGVGSTSAKDLAGPRDAVIAGSVSLAQSGGPGSSLVMLFGTDKTGILTPPSFPVYGLAFTLEFWMKPTVTPIGQSGLMSRAIINDGDFQVLYQAASGNITTNFFQGAHQVRSFPVTLTLGAWLYVVVVFTGTQVQVYLNTVAQGLQATLTGSNGTGPPSLGNMADGPTNGFVGALADMAFYQKVLSVSDINAHFALRTTT
jgi:hypothetical protein